MTPNTLKRLIYQCTYRGMKELDLLLGSYLKTNGAELSLSEINLLKEFLEEPEQVILANLLGRKETINKYSVLISKIRSQYADQKALKDI